MDVRKRLALAGTATILTAVALAFAAPATAGVTAFNSSASPSTGVKNGTVVTVTGTGAPANTKFLCVQLVLNESTEVNAPKNSTIKSVTSDATGTVTCTQTFTSFTASDSAGGTRHCPLTQADYDANFRCGVGLADQATFGETHGSFANFHVVGDATKRKTTTGGTTTGTNTTGGSSTGTNTSGSNNTATGPNSVAAGSGGLADRVHRNTALLAALAGLGVLLIGASGWRLVRR